MVELFLHIIQIYFRMMKMLVKKMITKKLKKVNKIKKKNKKKKKIQMKKYKKNKNNKINKITEKNKPKNNHKQ